MDHVEIEPFKLKPLSSAKDGTSTTRSMSFCPGDFSFYVQHASVAGVIVVDGHNKDEHLVTEMEMAFRGDRRQQAKTDEKKMRESRWNLYTAGWP